MLIALIWVSDEKLTISMQLSISNITFLIFAVSILNFLYKIFVTSFITYVDINKFLFENISSLAILFLSSSVAE